jgi:hypothetical protein
MNYSKADFCHLSGSSKEKIGAAKPVEKRGFFYIRQNLFTLSRFLTRRTRSRSHQGIWWNVRAHVSNEFGRTRSNAGEIVGIFFP